MCLHLLNTWIDNESSQSEEVDFGSKIYYFSPFPLFVCMCMLLCEIFVCMALLSPFVLGFGPSIFFFFLLKKNFFPFFLIMIFYFNNFILSLFYFILSSFFLSIFSPFYSEPCGWKTLGAPARCQGCASEVGEPSSAHWSTRDLPAPRNTKWWKSPRDLHLNSKTQLHSTTSKLQCWTSYAKQLARQEHSSIH